MPNAALTESSQKKFFLILCVYFGLHVAIRTLISGTADLDESEQLVLTQKFACGYGWQPPLYTWLQIFFFKTFGVSIFSLALLKNLLLLSIYLFTYFNVRFVTRSSLCGILGATSLLFIPQVAWESQRDLTHSVLASAIVTATLFVFLRLRKNAWGGYVALGTCMGLGLLSKYNYAAFFSGLALAAVTLSEFRPRILNKKILLSLAICFVILLPHLHWAFFNRAALASTAYQFHRHSAGELFSDATLGVGRLLAAVLFHVGPFAAIFLGLFFRRIVSAGSFDKNIFAQLFARQYLFIVAGLLGAILVLRATGFKDRWFEPIFISLPLLVFSLAGDWIQPRQKNFLLLFGGVVALAVLTIIPGRILFAEKLSRVPLPNAPFQKMGNELAKQIPRDALLIAENKWIGGNLRLLFPERNVVTADLAKLFSATNRTCVVIWDATRRQTPSLKLDQFVGEFSEKNPSEAEIHFAEAVYQYHNAKKFRLGISTPNP